MEGDLRSFRVALVADRYVNPPPGGLDGLTVLAGKGWGIVQLPPEDYPPATAAKLLAEVAEQVEEFSRHGYELVLVGEREGLTAALAALAVAVPEQVVPESTGELLRFLGDRPAAGGPAPPTATAGGPAPPTATAGR